MAEHRGMGRMFQHLRAREETRPRDQCIIFLGRSGDVKSRESCLSEVLIQDLCCSGRKTEPQEFKPDVGR